MVAGRFKLVRRLASTEMSVVYCAESEQGLVALKLLHATTDATAERCLREARAMSRVRNPHVVQAIEYGRSPGQHVFIVMEYLDGESLAETLDQEGKLPWRRVVHIARQLAEALAATHAEGIIHRDVKPSNCMRIERGGDPDFIKLLDFGISKSLDERFATKTTTGAILGTPAYMAPELSSTGSPDVASDIYSLGATLYHLVTGRLPFVGETAVDYHYHHSFTALISPLERDPELGLPEAFDRLIVRALAKSPADRFESVSEVVHALDQLLPTSERPSPLRLVTREPSTDEIATTEKPVDPPALGADDVRAIEAATRGAASSRIAATRTFRGVPSGPSDFLTPSSGGDATPLVTEAMRTASDVEAPLPAYAVVMRAMMLLFLAAICGIAWSSLAPIDPPAVDEVGDGLFVSAPPPLRPLPGATAPISPTVAAAAPPTVAAAEPPTPTLAGEPTAATADAPVPEDMPITPPDPSPFPDGVPVTEPDPPAPEDLAPPAPATAPFPRKEAQAAAKPALDELRGCAERAKLWGVLKISVQVDESGGLKRVRVRDPKGAPAAFLRCAERELGVIAFPTHPDGGSFDLTVDVSVFLPVGKKK